MNVTPAQFLSVRYGRNTNSQSTARERDSVPENWGDSENTFNSFNLNHNWVLGGGKLNEFIFQYADFANGIAAEQRRSAAHLQQRRVDRLQHQHAADDGAAEVAVPRRLLVAREPGSAGSATISRWA